MISTFGSTPDRSVLRRKKMSAKKAMPDATDTSLAKRRRSALERERRQGLLRKEKSRIYLMEAVGKITSSDRGQECNAGHSIASLSGARTSFQFACVSGREGSVSEGANRSSIWPLAFVLVNRVRCERCLFRNDEIKIFFGGRKL